MRDETAVKRKQQVRATVTWSIVFTSTFCFFFGGSTAFAKTSTEDVPPDPPSAESRAGGGATANEGSHLVYGPVTVEQVRLNDENRALIEQLSQSVDRLTSELGAVRASAAEAKAAAVRQAAEDAAREQALGAQIADLRASRDTVPRVASGMSGLRVGGYAQFDYVARQSSVDEVNQSTGEPLNENRFSLRRSRFKMTMERGFVAGLLELDANTVRGVQVRPVGMEATLRWPSTDATEAPAIAAATVGMFKIPFGFEVLQSDAERLFMERSTVVRALFPGEFDLGARLAGGWRFLRYAIALQNGDPLGERAFPARDPNDAKDLTGRAGVDFADLHPATFSGGFSALVGKGFHKGTPATKPSIFWQDRNENGVFETGELQTTPGVAAQPSSNFSRHALGADGRLAVDVPVLGRLTVGGEVVWAKNLDRAVLPADPFGPTGRDLREFGFNAYAVQELGPHVVVGFRFDSYDPDRDSIGGQAGLVVPVSTIYRTWAVAAAVQSKAGRLMVEYDVNRNHNGRDTNGLPVNLADNAFTLRGEVRF